MFGASVDVAGGAAANTAVGNENVEDIVGAAWPRVRGGVLGAVKQQLVRVVVVEGGREVYLGASCGGRALCAHSVIIWLGEPAAPWLYASKVAARRAHEGSGGE